MDYQKLGLKCGIEIHQQLEGKKLFCKCPTLLRDDEADFIIRRKLRASAGESGKIDIAALQEQLKGKTFVYHGYNDTTCLVETDSEPPHKINEEAIYTSLQFCKLVDADVSEVVQVMRKTVIDGSNTSGFQRTALMSRGGTIKTSLGEVRIENVSLEEDSCKIISENSEQKIYNLDRLGIPLIEIGTAPDIVDPNQCKETAEKLGMLLRSLSGVKRGLGTIRQDVNVSIRHGNRVEIKGAQDLKMIPILVELEVKRQLELLKIKEELRNLRLVEFKIIDLSVLMENCDSKIIQEVLIKGGKVLGIRLNNFSGLIGRELQPNYRLGTEFSGRAKIKAQVGGILHSDELPKYGIEEQIISRIRKKLQCVTKDGFVLVAAEESKARKALEAVYERVLECLRGIPKEVRKANQDGTTSFLRPMPGAARMYPETDVPLVFPNLSEIELPELLEEKIKRYQQDMGLSNDLAILIAKSDKVKLFEELVEEHPKIKAGFIADTLTGTLREIKRRYQLDSSILNSNNFKELFSYLEEEKIHKDIILDVLIEMIKGTFSIEKYAGLSTEDLHQKLKKLVDENKNVPFPALMGMAMKELAGQASGKIISQALKEIIQEGHK